ncbi:hypothetical protein V6C03_09250 [Methyloligella sp. 2.7D]|uniref:hypothetical protein n=1 Tax=unclassified Methyloligella TaxID=2625955 RepID=UPI00157CBA61|nr:hypothetical protein [Methyloligella sp. GL2]QKP77958.1 hypothetical protein HT051_11200 [Methyloligella sp. GL2]
MSKHHRYSFAAGALAVLLLAGSAALAQDAQDAADDAKKSGAPPVAANVERVANIQAAAKKIAALQGKEGGEAAVAEVNACYARELKGATTVTPGIEGCMMQDIAVSRLFSAMDDRHTPEERKEKGIPDPQQGLQDMALRIQNMFNHFNMPDGSINQFVALVDEYGMEVYRKTLIANMPADAVEDPGHD